jgi:hypothetical protein
VTRCEAATKAAPTARYVGWNNENARITATWTTIHTMSMSPTTSAKSSVLGPPVQADQASTVSGMPTMMPSASPARTRLSNGRRSLIDSPKSMPPVTSPTAPAHAAERVERGEARQPWPARWLAQRRTGHFVILRVEGRRTLLVLMAVPCQVARLHEHHAQRGVVGHSPVGTTGLEEADVVQVINHIRDVLPSRWPRCRAQRPDLISHSVSDILPVVHHCIVNGCEGYAGLLGTKAVVPVERDREVGTRRVSSAS